MSKTTDRIDAPFVVCKAAAGSGKTFTLVLEYLKMALAGPREGLSYRFRSILAITFTNKAANEMKGRVMKELDCMATEGIDIQAEKTFGAQLFAAMSQMDYYRRNPLSPADLQAMAAELQSAILHHYTDLSVFTIDSFMHRIVRTFAHDLGQPVSFEVMTDQQMLVDEAVAQLMSLVGTEGNDELTSLLQAFADSNMDDGYGYNVEVAIADLANLLFNEDISQRLKRLAGLSLADFRAIHRRYSAANRAAEQRLRSLGAEFLALVEPTGLAESDCFQASKGFLRYFKRLADGEMKEPNNYVVSSLTGGKLVSAKCDGALEARLEGLRPQMERLFERVQAFFERDFINYCTRRLILANLYSTALLGHLFRILGEYSHSNEVLHLSEFNRMINSVVEDEDNPAPFIFERLGNRYRHFLIDEFQDTSIMQWHNLVPLVENGVSQGQESLVVGDAKQAIYRFRQGDVRQFVALPKVEGMRSHGRTLALPGNSCTVLRDANYRTDSAVVDFNNDFFAWLVRNQYADNQLAQDIYVGRNADGSPRDVEDEELRQRKDKADTGHVGVAFIDDNDRQSVFAEVKATIEMLVAERGYSHGDICILARSNRQLAQLSAWLTANSDIPQTSNQSFLVQSSDAAMAVVAALRWLHNRRDRVAATDLLQRLVNLGIVDAGLTAAMADESRPDLAEMLRSSGSGIELEPDSLASLGLYDCCEELVRRLRIDGIDIPYVASLLNAVAAFAARHQQQEGDFLQWFDEHPDLSAATSEGLDAVRLLTIHKAKGLEAPVIICMFLPQVEKMPHMWVDVPEEEGVDGPQLPTAYVQFVKDMPTRFDAQREGEMQLARVDDLNVLYVALTRPREQLYIICQHSATGYAALLQQYLGEQLDADGRAHFGEEGWFKTPAVGSGAERHNKTVVPLRKLSYSRWTSKVSIASPAERAVTPLLDDKQRFGIYAHELMASIVRADDVDAAVADFCTRYPLDENEIDTLRRMARATVNHPEAARFFASGNRVENEVSLVDGGQVGRPDRVVFTDTATWVVDFKTGGPAPSHAVQVRNYCRSIADMGFPAVSGWLLYLHEDGVDVVPVE